MFEDCYSQRFSTSMGKIAIETHYIQKKKKKVATGAEEREQILAFGMAKGFMG